MLLFAVTSPSGVTKYHHNHIFHIMCAFILIQRAAISDQKGLDSRTDVESGLACVCVCVHTCVIQWLNRCAAGLLPTQLQIYQDCIYALRVCAKCVCVWYCVCTKCMCRFTQSLTIRTYLLRAIKHSSDPDLIPFSSVLSFSVSLCLLWLDAFHLINSALWNHSLPYLPSSVPFRRGNWEPASCTDRTHSTMLH